MKTEKKDKGKNPLNIGMIISSCLIVMIASVLYLGATQVIFNLPDTVSKSIGNFSISFAGAISNVTLKLFSTGQSYPWVFFCFYYIVLLLAVYNIILNLYRTVKYYRKKNE